MTDEELIPFLVSAHFFAGCGGDICGFEQADWTPTFAVELKKDRCQTIRANNPFIKIFQGPIQSMTNDAYPNKPVTLFFMTFPCDNYTLAANVHKHWTGDELYLEALREVVLHYPELIVIENVWGIKKFKRVMETFRTLPLYHCTEFLLYGDDFTHQRKKRVFLLLHRQPYLFPPIAQYRLPRPGHQLKDYLEMDRPLPKTPNYAYDRLDGKYRDRPKIYDPEQLTPVNLFTDIDHDRSYHLVKDARAHRGIRIFSPREQANLHTFPKTYTFVGSDTAQYGMVVDSVMPHMAYAIAQASKDYLRAIPALAERPMALGHRILPSLRAQHDEEIEEARQIIAEPSPRIDPTTTHQLALW